jgi:hypothetical protein
MRIFYDQRCSFETKCRKATINDQSLQWYVNHKGKNRLNFINGSIDVTMNQCTASNLKNNIDHI